MFTISNLYFVTTVESLYLELATGQKNLFEIEKVRDKESLTLLDHRIWNLISLVIPQKPTYLGKQNAGFGRNYLKWHSFMVFL